MGGRDWRALLPREHGSWAYLLGPQVAAILGADRPLPAFLWMIGTLLLFASFQGFAAARRRRSRGSLPGVIAGAAGAVLIVLLARDRPLALLALAPSLVPAGLGLLAYRGRLGRQSLLEVAGIVGAATAATGGLYLAGGGLRACGLLAIPASAFFLLGLIWIRHRLARELPGRSPLLPAGWNLPAGLCLLLASNSIGLALREPVPGLLPALYLLRAFLPAPRDRAGRLRVVGLGIQETALAILFSVGLGLFLPS